MRRDTWPKSSLFMRKRLLFCQVSLFIFGRLSYIKALVIPQKFLVNLNHLKKIVNLRKFPSYENRPSIGLSSCFHKKKSPMVLNWKRKQIFSIGPKGSQILHTLTDFTLKCSKIMDSKAGFIWKIRYCSYEKW